MIWIIGSRGMLGQEMTRVLSAKKFSFIATDQEVDITRAPVLTEFYQGHQFDWIINCAAYTAVDQAEDEPEPAFRLNRDAVQNLAQLAEQTKATLVHFSTDYVFDGQATRPYREDDPPNPLSLYGQSKLAGETVLAESRARYFLFRISWLYGRFGRNFITTIMHLCQTRDRLRVVQDEVGSPTYTHQLALNIAALLSRPDAAAELYHYSDDGVISRYDLAIAIQELGLEFGLLDRQIPIEPISANQYPTKAARPAFSPMDTRCVQEKLGFTVKPWRENLRHYFAELR